ncbi:uncharacterized protein LOC144625151 isoform X1 [Crassostrea virginica]
MTNVQYLSRGGANSVAPNIPPQYLQQPQRMAHEDSVRKKPNYYWTDHTMDQAVSAILKDRMSVNKASKIFNVPRKILTERAGGRVSRSKRPPKRQRPPQNPYLESGGW